MTIQVGEHIPRATLKVLDDEGFYDVTTDDLFRGRKVVLFGVPGPFTPTCSAEHLPGYVNNADALMAKGVDAIVCVAVNDAFVMKAWGDSLGVDGKIRMVSDGNAELTRKLGLELDATSYCMGTRCQRFSMVVDDGEVTALNLDPPGTFDSSGAEAMLRELS